MEIKEPEKKKIKERKTIAVDSTVWSKFLENMEKKKISASSVLGDFMAEVNKKIAEGGGELYIGIYGDNWFNPTTKDKLRLAESRVEKLKQEEAKKD